eukprot:403351864
MLLENIGYKQELYRGFNSFMSFSFCFSSIAVISSLSLVINYGLETGGPAVMVWGWIISCLFTLIVGLSLSEICSVYPVAGSVYYWAGALSSDSWAPVNSYVCGWLYLIGNIACDSSFAFGFSQMLTAIIQMGSEGRIIISQGVQVFIAILILFFWALKNGMRLDKQGWFNNGSAVYQLVSTIVIVLVIVLFSQSISSHEFVWTTYNNETGFNSVLYVCLIGVLMSSYGMSGYESGATLAEETQHASKNAPLGIMKALVLSSIIGFAFILGLLYASQNNLTSVLSGVSDSSVVNIIDMTFTNNLSGQKNLAMAVIVCVLLLINIFLAGFSHMTVTTRITYAMARDGALPKSQWLSFVNEKTQNPDHHFGIYSNYKYHNYRLSTFLLHSNLCKTKS